MARRLTTDNFRVSPSILGPLGAEQLNDPALALLELVKNSWDADANNVRIKVSKSSIRISDDGHGMDRKAFVEKWLTIGTPNKRIDRFSPEGRPLIGEKGLGRLATFALGRALKIKSSAGKVGFEASVDWAQLMKSTSLEDYPVTIRTSERKKGTDITIRPLTNQWTRLHTEFLVDHLRFLTSVPEEDFEIHFSDPWDEYQIEDQDALLKEISETSISVTVNEEGEPIVKNCIIDGIDKSRVVFRKMSESSIDSSLAGVSINLSFFLRKASPKLIGALAKNRTAALLKEYAGVRVYLNGINVPPYGMRGNDWASLERQRTSTGAPTMTPGNSQLFGEVRLDRQTHKKFIVTAGRSGFADQQAVDALADYVKWTVRAIANGRRAAAFGIDTGAVPGRLKTRNKSDAKPTSPKKLRERITKSNETPSDVVSKTQLDEVIAEYESLWTSFSQNDEWLRLFAQLASSGIAATSFAHELRGDFDVMSSTIRQLTKPGAKKAQLIDTLEESWASIRSFASLFQMMPVRVRRKKQLLPHTKLVQSARKVANLAKSQGVDCAVVSQKFHVIVVPAEIDSITLNLVSNSLKAIKESNNRKSGKIRIEFTAVKGTLKISVLDNGCGVSSSVREVMFKPLEGSFREGTGMGLPIIQYLASQYRGTVSSCTPTNDDFVTEFRVELKRVVRGGVQ